MAHSDGHLLLLVALQIRAVLFITVGGSLCNFVPDSISFSNVCIRLFISGDFAGFVKLAKYPERLPGLILPLLSDLFLKFHNLAH